MIDLHTHSTCSDGSESPSLVVQQAAQAGCRAIALTDHDGLDGIDEARRVAAVSGIELVPGCEVSCTFSPGTMHLLSYFIEPGSGPLQDELGALRRDRERRNAQLVDRLNEIGVPISYEEVLEKANGGAVGRPHFAEVLVEMHLASSIADSFDRYLSKGAPAYVGKARLQPETIIEETAGSKGVAVLAHPLTLGIEPNELEATIEQLAENGLSGLECYYGNYDAETRAELVRLARRHGLIPTGGSDFHGSYKPGLRIGVGRGDLEVPDEVLDELVASRPS